MEWFLCIAFEFRLRVKLNETFSVVCSSLIESKENAWMVLLSRESEINMCWPGKWWKFLHCNNQYLSEKRLCFTLVDGIHKNILYTMWVRLLFSLHGALYNYWRIIAMTMHGSDKTLFVSLDCLQCTEQYDVKKIIWR